MKRMKDLTQISFDEVDESYKAFVDKFKPKKTTDDCYTPDNIYQVIKDWAVKEYGIDPNNIVRPFYPNGDYKKEHYPEGCTVLDNPPFSILSEIIKTYARMGIKYFLFAPTLTIFSTAGNDKRQCCIITDARITYENNAHVNTSFITNLDPYLVRTAPDLRQLIREQDDINTKEQKRQLPKYIYPVNVLTSATVAHLARHCVDYRVRKNEALFARVLDDQKRYGKTLFGSGLLLTEKAAAEKAAAEKAVAENVITWQLSEREKELLRMLEEQSKRDDEWKE